MTNVMEHFDDKVVVHCDEKGISIVKRRPWSILMTCVMELCDDNVMEHFDYRCLGAL